MHGQNGDPLANKEDENDDNDDDDDDSNGDEDEDEDDDKDEIDDEAEAEAEAEDQVRLRVRMMGLLSPLMATTSPTSPRMRSPLMAQTQLVSRSQPRSRTLEMHSTPRRTTQRQLTSTPRRFAIWTSTRVMPVQTRLCSAPHVSSTEPSPTCSSSATQMRLLTATL